MDRISSRQNPIVKRFRQVAAGGPAGTWVLLDGDHLVGEALASGIRIEVAAIGEFAGNGLHARMVTALEQSGASVVPVTPEVLSVISPVKQRSSVVAIAQRRHVGFEDVLRG